jgi:hypothetical protein
MSLDIYMSEGEETHECVCRCGHTHTRIEPIWAEDLNITHNLGEMAEQAEIYDAMWGADGATARDLIPALRLGLFRLKDNPEYYRLFNPPNGWGSNETLMDFVERYLSMCENHPEATIRVSR